MFDGYIYYWYGRNLTNDAVEALEEAGLTAEASQHLMERTCEGSLD
jgi:hypothetical protein